MIRRSEIFLKELVLLIDAAVISAAFLTTYFLRKHIHQFYHFDVFSNREVFTPLKMLEDYLWLLLIILPLWLGVLHMMGAYHQMRTKRAWRMSWVILKANLLSLLFFGSIVFLLRLQYVSRSFMTLFFVLGFASLSFERAFLLFYWRALSRQPYFQKKVLVAGTGKRARTFIRAIQNHPDWGFRLVGLLDKDTELIGKLIEGVEVRGLLQDLPRLLKEEVIDEVIFVVPRSWMTEIEEGILHCERVGVRATVAADLFNVNFAKALSSDLEGLPTISFEMTPVDQWQLAVKRTGDFFASLLGLIALFPLFMFVSLLIKTTSRGPIFFTQIRSGLNGRVFTLYKFRSMAADAEARRGEVEHLNEMGGPVFKAANDPRVTPLGKWLRKTSIDELPQLINVLKGEMSLVGPRPPLPSEVAKYEIWQRRRLSMRPGITGWWQVKGRNRIRDFNEWMRLDLEYIDRWTLGFDVRILLRTIPIALFGIGAK